MGNTTARRWGALVGLLALLAAACSAGSSAHSSAGTVSSASHATAPGAPDGTDHDVSFTSGGVVVHGSLRRPPHAVGAAPAALILAGSGPTDRNGDNTLVNGPIGTLSFIAAQLARLGVVSLRYDKFGTGSTGTGGVSPNAPVTFERYVQEARDGLRFLARQPGVDRRHLIVVGHSEGALIALALTTDGDAEPADLVLVNAPGQRYLDLIAQQARRTAPPALTPEIDAAVADVRAGRPVSMQLPGQLAEIFSPANAIFLRQADADDPSTLAHGYGTPHRVLVTCGEQDVQVPCADAALLAASFPPGVATFARLARTDHVLKTTDHSDTTEYGEPLPYSAAFAGALAAFVHRLD